MKKLIFSLFVLSFLTACAGNPPAWWNPGNVYSNTGRQTVSKEKQQPNPAQAGALLEEMEDEPTEVSISVSDESYEEMALTPLQDEENEELSGDSSAQSVTPTEEDFTADSSVEGLPLPSVLE